MILPADQAHHLRDVLRLQVGDAIDLFDDAGQSAQGRLVISQPLNVSVEIADIHPAQLTTTISVASAVPKGDRADWMIEKLSEIGVTRFIPLKTDRSVVHPEGRAKLDRWRRIAIESAKQCRRVGVMGIEELRDLRDCVMPAASSPGESHRLFLDTGSGAGQLITVTRNLQKLRSVELFIGPAGGWTGDEISRFLAAGLTGVSLTTTILRIETAAVIAAGVIACSFDREDPFP
mgnify:CR=1 FL=1